MFCRVLLLTTFRAFVVWSCAILATLERQVCRKTLTTKVLPGTARQE